MDKLTILAKLGRANDSLHHAANVVDYLASRVRTGGETLHCYAGVHRAAVFALMGLQYLLQSLESPTTSTRESGVHNAGEWLTFRRTPAVVQLDGEPRSPANE